MKQSFDEKRKFSRTTVNHHVPYRLVGQEQFSEGIVGNIGREGLALSTVEPVPHNSTIQLLCNASVWLTAVTVWSDAVTERAEKAEGKYGYQIGCRIIKVTHLETANAQRGRRTSSDHPVEDVLRDEDIQALKRSENDVTKDFPGKSKREGVHKLLEDIALSTDRSNLINRLRSRGKPVYETDPQFPGMVIKIDPDGTRTPGRFENRRFVPAAGVK